MSKPSFHFRSADGSVVPLAFHLQRLGYPVSLWVKSPEAAKLATGMIKRVNGPSKGDIVFYDCTGMGAEGQSFRQKGFTVIGGNPFDKKLELDRPAGAKIMQDHGIKTPETYPFSTIPQAVKFLEKQDGAWFVKVSGDQVESATFDAPTPSDMIRYLQYVEKKGKVEPFELQRKVKGTEISTNGFFDGEEFIPPFDITIEEKCFLDGDRGPRTGCESCIVWHDRKGKLPKGGLAKIEDILRKEKYVGPCDLNAMIQEDGSPLGLEWTARLGFDATQAWMHLFGKDLGEQLEAFAHQELPVWEPSIKGYSMTLRVSIPPYPTWEPKLIAKTQGIPLDEAVLEPPFDPVDVMEEEDGPVAAGSSGIIGTISAVSEDLDVARSQIHHFAHHLVIPNYQHRNVLVKRAERDLAAISKLGMV